MSSLLSRYAAYAGKRPGRVLVGYLLSFLLLGGVVGGVGAGFSDQVSLGSTDSQAATNLLTDRFPAAAGDSATIVFHKEDGRVDSEPAVSSVLGEIGQQLDVQTVTPLQSSQDGKTAFVNVLYTKSAADLTAAHLTRLETTTAKLDAAQIETSMRGAVVDRWRDREMPVGEFFGLLAALVLVTILFRSFIATLITVGSALIGLALGNTVLALASGFIDIPTVAPTIAIMLGLGAGVDYALFLVAKFRNRLRAGDDINEALKTANATTGVSVLTAGAIVVVSICGLYVTGITIIGRMGMAAALVVAIAAMTSVVLVPAFLRLAGDRVLPRKERSGNYMIEGAEGRISGKIARTVSKRPIVGTLLSSIFLLSIAAPALSIELGQPDDRNRPEGNTTRVAYERLSEAFGPGFNGPLLIAVDLDSPSNKPTIETITSRLLTTEGVASVSPASLNPTGDTAVINVIPTTAPQDKATSDLVAKIRNEVLPSALAGTNVTAHVGGQTATFDDLGNKVSSNLLKLILVVVALSLLLLAVAFRSVALPIASAFMNLLSIGAAYGVVKLAFQTEAGAALLGVDQQPIVSFVPMLMFAILFGLSMDYNVFLISAVREARRAGETAKRAVVSGVKNTSSLITVAGAIMTLVFLGFTVTNEVEVKMIGLGLAVAVLIDVTVVRLILAPSLLTLLGERSWWFPTLGRSKNQMEKVSAYV